MSKEEIKIAVKEAMQEVLDPLFVDREQHYKDHLAVQAAWPNPDAQNEHKNHHNFLSKWFKRTEKVGGKIFTWVIFGLIVIAVSMTFEGFLIKLLSFLAKIPIVGGYVKKVGK